MIKAVFFDAIDTLFCAYPNKIGMYQRIIKEKTGLDVSEEKMTEVWNEVLYETEKEAEKEIEFHKKQQAWQHFNEIILEKLGYKGDLLEKGEELRTESWSNPENFKLYEDVVATLKKLKELNLLIGCVSNESKGLKNFFTHFGISAYFDEIVISEVVKCEKPSIEIFNKALEGLKLNPEDVLFIGDSIISDYEGAQNAGLNAVVIDREGKISDNNVKTINNLNEIVNLIKGEKYARTAS